MAKKNQVFIDVVVDDKGTTKRVAVNAKKLGLELDKAGVATDKATKSTDKLGKSNKDLDRNLRGTAKMTSNGTKEFSKMQQGMGGLVGAYATLAAQVFAVSAAFQFLQVASDFRNLIAGQEALGATTGVAFKTITESIIQATDAQIQYGEAARAAAIGTAAGLSPSQLTDLGNAAKNASFALGRDLTDSFNRLIRGVTKAEPELLDELGIILRLETATEKYAVSLGKARNELDAFERTQAVANDVLDQAERKFGAIEALMDPNAAALNQFTKSFDDLIKGFQVGLIETLIPVLTFLSQNTAALTASLSLFALPILKAILPAMDKWAESSRKAADEAKKLSKTYGEELDAQTAKLEDNLKRRQAAADKAAKVAKSTAARQGTGIRAGSGLDFLTGGEEKRGAQGAATRILNNARKQMNEQGQILTGDLKGYNEEQLRDMEKSHKKRIAVSKTSADKIRSNFDTLGIQIKRTTAGIGTFWQATMAKMAGVAAATATFINTVFFVAGLVGALVLVGSAIKAVADFLFPLTDEMKAQQKTVEDLSEKYSKLNEELERSAEARRTLLGGTQIASNEGKALQSIDVPAFLDGLQQLELAEAKGADGTDDLREALTATGVQLGKIDPQFKSLIDKNGQLAKVNDETAITFRNLANDIIRTGQEIDNLPRLFTKLDSAFSKLTQGAVKLTPIQEYLKASEDVLENLKMQVEKNEEIGIKQSIAISDAITARAKQKKADEDYFAALANGGKMELEIFNQLSERQKQDERIRQNMRVVEGAILKQELDAMSKALGLSEDELKIFLKQIKTEETRQELIKPFEAERVRRQEKLSELQDKATASMNLGLTVQGRIGNLETKRLQIANKFEKAIQNQKRFELALAVAVKESGMSEEEALKKKNEKVVKQRQELDAANSIFETAQRQNELDKISVDLQEKRLEFEKSILSERLKLVAAQEKENRLKREQRIGETLGGEGFGSAAERRQSTIDAAQATVEARKEAVKIAQATFDNELRVQSEAIIEQSRKTGFANLARDLSQLREGLTAGPQGEALRGQQRGLADAQGDLTIAQNSLKAQQQELNIQGEKAQFQLEEIALTERQKFIQDQIVIAKMNGNAANEEGLDALRAQSGAVFDLMKQEERRQSIADSIRLGMEGAFTSLIDGTKSAKEAFADMAKSILKRLASIIAEMLVAKVLSASIFGGFFEDGGVTTTAAKGAMTPKKQYAGGGYTSPLRNYSRGGMARGPQQGYNAVLHGNEAVVPLPDNRHIPVELSGGMGQQNIVTVNVNMDGQGSAQTSSESNGPNAERMGNMIAKAVQDELQNQKRSGGILSPYGVA